MGFFSKLFQKLKGENVSSQKGYTRQEGRQGLWIYLQCDHCGEKIGVRLRKSSELQRREGPDESGGPGEFFVRKTVVGSKCYRRIEATVDFDARYNVVGSEVINGKLITFEEYKKEQ